MKNIVILLISLFAFAGFAKAQETSEQCLINISLFNESAKNKQYADAFTPWKAAYQECPGANRAIYTRGREILNWVLAQPQDETAYQENFNLLMDMYDNRIKYFGNDTKYPTPWILGLKGLDYITYVKNDDLKKDAYRWLEQSVNGMGEKTELEVLRQFVLLSALIYRAEPQHAEKFVADYLKATEIIEKQINNPSNKNAEVASQIKQALDYAFVQSGAAECPTLDNIYSAKVNENLQNLEYLNMVMSFYRLVGCVESEVYFAAAMAAHEIQPTAESANGNAQMAYKKEDYNKAIEYYEEATTLEQDVFEKAEYQYKIAQIYYNDLKNYSRSRQYARKSLEFNPNNGKAYILIGLMYANSKNINDDPVLQKAVYWVAVDKFVRARQVDSDPAIVQSANELVNRYSVYFPTKEEIFFQPTLNVGDTYRVGGWIEETTTIRATN